MKILFCGTMLPEKYENIIKDLSSAGNRFQWNFIKALRKQGIEVAILSYVGIPLGDTDRNQLEQDCQKENIVPVIKDRDVITAVLDFQRKMKPLTLQADWVFSYNVVYSWLNLCGIAHRRGKHAALVLADYSPRQGYEDTIRKLYASFQMRAIGQYDIVVALSDHVKDILKKNQQILIMEGGIDLELYKSFDLLPYHEGKRIRLMYSGLLSQVTGVDLLLKAFRRLTYDNVQLVITGKGNLEEMVAEYQSADRRIQYYGHLKYEDYMDQLKEADILVNPRNMELPENKNNFPSKIMEYLASGKVIVSTQFAGWEKFQGSMIFSASDEVPLCNALKKAIDEYPHIYKQIYEANRHKSLEYGWENQIHRVLKLM